MGPEMSLTTFCCAAVLAPKFQTLWTLDLKPKPWALNPQALTRSAEEERGRSSRALEESRKRMAKAQKLQHAAEVSCQEISDIICCWHPANSTKLMYAQQQVSVDQDVGKFGRGTFQTFQPIRGHVFAVLGGTCSAQTGESRVICIRLQRLGTHAYIRI